MRYRKLFRLYSGKQGGCSNLEIMKHKYVNIDTMLA